MRSTNSPRKNINNPRHAHYYHQLKTDSSQCSSETISDVCHFLFIFSCNKRNKGVEKSRDREEKLPNDKNHFAYRSVVDFTSSRFQRPQVSCLAVDRNSKTFTHSRIPMGPKKYAKISISPESGSRESGKQKNINRDGRLFEL